jgi:hypothetical protein
MVSHLDLERCRTYQPLEKELGDPQELLARLLMLLALLPQELLQVPVLPLEQVLLRSELVLAQLQCRDD